MDESCRGRVDLGPHVWVIQNTTVFDGIKIEVLNCMHCGSTKVTHTSVADQELER